MDLLYILLVLLLVTRVCGEFAVRLKQPALVGELISGILVGVVVNRFHNTFPILSEVTENPVFTSITDLGVFFLMLLAGLEMHPKELIKSSGSAFAVALAGLIVPLGAGITLGMYALPESEWKTAQVMFLATAMAITAIPVAVKVLMDIGQLQSKAGKIIVSAAVYDDIFGLVLLAILTALLQTGEVPSLVGFATLIGKVVLFFIAATFLGWYALPRLSMRLSSACFSSWASHSPCLPRRFICTSSLEPSWQASSSPVVRLAPRSSMMWRARSRQSPPVFWRLSSSLPSVCIWISVR